MADNLTAEQRKKNMQNIKSTKIAARANTTPDNAALQILTNRHL